MLVERKSRRRIFLLSSLSATCAAISSIVTFLDLSIYDDALPSDLLVGTLGFDVMSLVVALGLFACLRALSRGAEGYWLLWLGLQGYLLYAYAIYAFGMIFTPLYFLYIAIVGLSAYVLAGFTLSFNVVALRHWREASVPRRSMGAILLLVAGAFGALWLIMLSGVIAQDVEIAAATVIVLDLAFALPLLVVVAVMLLRHRPLGDLLATGAFAMSAAITLAVAVGEMLRPVFGETFSVVMTLPYLIPGFICLVCAIVAFRRIGRTISHVLP
jgi:hypothetical protein